MNSENSKYILWFDFPMGKTYLLGTELNSSFSGGNLEVPEFTTNTTDAKIFTNKEEALKYGYFFAGKYGYGVELRNNEGY